MCILVLKRKDVGFPSMRIVRNCVKANPDGFSMAWNNGRELYTFRTMNADKFMEVYHDIASSMDPKKTAMMLHMRIATHGSKNANNCHCWRGEILGTEYAFAHNGILSIRNRGDMTDSETFLRDYIEDVESIGEFFDIIERGIGYSKFGFIDGDGNIIHFGHFNEMGGVLYSNYSYQGSQQARQFADPRLWESV